MPDTFPEPHAEFVKETKVVPGICSRCGGSTTGQDVDQGAHRYFPHCFVVMKAENERLTKLAAEPLQVRDASRERSTADLEAKRSIELVAKSDITALVNECREHNREHHHITSEETLRTICSNWGIQ